MGTDEELRKVVSPCLGASNNPRGHRAPALLDVFEVINLKRLDWICGIYGCVMGRAVVEKVWKPLTGNQVVEAKYPSLSMESNRSRSRELCTGGAIYWRGSETVLRSLRR